MRGTPNLAMFQVRTLRRRVRGQGFAIYLGPLDKFATDLLQRLRPWRRVRLAQYSSKASIGRGAAHSDGAGPVKDSRYLRDFGRRCFVDRAYCCRGGLDCVFFRESVRGCTGCKSITPFRQSYNRPSCLCVRFSMIVAAPAGLKGRSPAPCTALGNPKSEPDKLVSVRYHSFLGIPKVAARRSNSFAGGVEKFG
jgi:hypothetical protein